jgi:pimeloyl-ACP methyl ester carboxylesterase
VSRAEPFRIQIPDPQWRDLRHRLSHTLLPHEPDGNEDWHFGTYTGFMRRLVPYWRDRFDWRAAEAELNRFPHFMASIAGEHETHRIHFIREKGSGPAPAPLILTHGWPSTFREFTDVIDRLAHPERFGGKAEDGFDVIVPSLLGFGFSSKPRVPIGPAAIAELWHTLMSEVLGYGTYFAQAGDWGSFVTSRLALQHPEALRAMHLTMLPLRPHLKHASQAPVSEEEARWIAEMKAWWRQEEGYRVIQSTKPMALAYGLSDSPGGLAAWLADKYWRLGDTRKNHPWEGFEARFPMEVFCMQASIYWFTNTINSANTLYWAGPREGSGALKPGERVTVPTGYSEYPIDTLPITPRSWADRMYDIAQFKVMTKGGHFAAMEEPALFADDVRQFFRAFR